MIKLTKKLRQKLLKNIGSDGLEEISTQFNVSTILVRKVINGERNNDDILIFAVELASEKSKKLDNMKKYVISKIQSI